MRSGFGGAIASRAKGGLFPPVVRVANFLHESSICAFCKYVMQKTDGAT